jgi:hypothetical protein
MFHQTPEQRLIQAKLRHVELIREADEFRLARRHRDAPAGHRSTRLLSSIRAWLGQSLVGLRPALLDREAPCRDPYPDRNPC